MRAKLLPMLLFFHLVFLLSMPLIHAQTEENELEELKKQAPKVYIDFRRGDQNYIRTEIPFVNYVRDRQEADVHVLVTTQSTGSGGTEYTISFIGQNDYSDLNNTLIYASNKTNTSDEVRRGYVQVLKMGLLPYAARTPICVLLDVFFKEKDRVRPTSVIDKWNFWVFSFSARGRIDGETQKSSKDITGSFSANRVTLQSKLRMSISGSYDENKYEYDDETKISISERATFSGLYAISLSEHWSIGTFLTVNTSSYSNIELSINPAPAIEYNLFPYSESTRRQLRFTYKLGYNYSTYREETIYQKMSEDFWGQSLDISFEVKEPWGTARASVEGSHYFHDFKQNRIELDMNFTFRILKGLSLTVDAEYERIRDQLNLPREDATLEEILLRRQELATDYKYQISIGFSYTFGSIYSNVVNPRFGNGGSDYRRFR
jgi:hypothetical protein